MKSYKDAIQQLLTSIKEPSIEIIALSDAFGRISADFISAPEPLPSFCNSAMDGFAIRAKDHLLGPWLIVDSIAAGAQPKKQVSTHQVACEIMTGAMVPDGFDTVIPVEATSFCEKDQAIWIDKPYQLGDNIRYPGEDFQQGARLLSPGERIQAKHMMILASFGITEIKVYRQMKAMILATGDELVDMHTHPLPPGKIRCSNGIYAKHYLGSLGVNADYIGHVPDELQTVKNILLPLLEQKPDIIVTTGAVSVGKWDFIPQLLTELQADIFFHRVAMRPGKPILAAQLPQENYFFGLPGNPISTLVGLRFFLTPLIRAYYQQPREKPTLAKLKQSFQQKHSLHTFYKAYTEFLPSGELVVDILPGQESFKMHPLLKANSWVVLTEQRYYSNNEEVEIYWELG